MSLDNAVAYPARPCLCQDERPQMVSATVHGVVKSEGQEGHTVSRTAYQVGD